MPKLMSTFETILTGVRILQRNGEAVTYTRIMSIIIQSKDSVHEQEGCAFGIGSIRPDAGVSIRDTVIQLARESCYISGVLEAFFVWQRPTLINRDGFSVFFDERYQVVSGNYILAA